MRISGLNPATGEQVAIESADANKDFVDAMMNFSLSEEDIKNLIDKLNVSADIKSALFQLSKTTIRIGQSILKIGRKIIDYIATIFKEFPSASFGMIFGAIVGFLISSIPFLGVVLGPIVTPIIIALGMIVGVYNDIQDKALVRRISEVNSSFYAFKTAG
jgi:hypothetical protein